MAEAARSFDLRSSARILTNAGIEPVEIAYDGLSQVIPPGDSFETDREVVEALERDFGHRGVVGYDPSEEKKEDALRRGRVALRDHYARALQQAHNYVSEARTDVRRGVVDPREDQRDFFAEKIRKVDALLGVKTIGLDTPAVAASAAVVIPQGIEERLMTYVDKRAEATLDAVRTMLEPLLKSVAKAK